MNQPKTSQRRGTKRSCSYTKSHRKWDLDSSASVLWLFQSFFAAYLCPGSNLDAENAFMWCKGCSQLLSFRTKCGFDLRSWSCTSEEEPSTYKIFIYVVLYWFPTWGAHPTGGIIWFWRRTFSPSDEVWDSPRALGTLTIQPAQPKRI